MVSDQELLDYHREGLIPGPDETEEEFLKRVLHCRQAKALFPEEEIPQEVLSQAHAITKKLFGMAPTWIPILFSNEKLLPWHGGCAWIFQVNAEAPLSGYLQLRRRFLKERSVWGYERAEILSHEMLHIGRMAFQEPKFEELLAYETSPKKWRRFIGPIIQSPWEVWLFLTGCILSIIISPVILLSLVFVAFLRLFSRHRTLDRCRRNFPFVHCLTDREIQAFSSMTKEAIQEYLKTGGTLRLKLLALMSATKL